MGKLEETQKRLVDLIPVQKFHTLLGGVNVETGKHEEDFEEVMRVADVESFLQKISHPQNLAKLVKAVTFGQKIDMAEILK